MIKVCHKFTLKALLQFYIYYLIPFSILFFPRQNFFLSVGAKKTTYAIFA